MHRNRVWQLNPVKLRTQRNRILPIEGGDGSTFSMDFTTGVLDSRLTFTRASTTATYINSSGYVTTAGTNVPRFDHDPTTRAPRGLLVEAQVTNLLNWSESFATSGGTNNNWASPNMTRGSGQADPANGTTAIRFTAIAPNATLISSAAIGSSAARTFSVWLRRVGAGTGDIQYTQNNGTNWNTQPITSTWTRYSFTHTADHRVGIRIVTSGNSIEIWGAQLEAGTGASSYIPTGASQATRNRDSATMSLSGDLVGFDRVQYTMLVRGRQNTNSFLTSFARSIRFIGASSEPIGFAVNGNTFFGTSRNSAAAAIAEVNPTNTLNQNFRFAWSLNANLTTGTMIGSLNQVPSSANRQNLGPMENFTTFSINTNSADTSYASMTIRDFKFWPVAKTASELNALTAG
jgi:hypothetical protein